MIKLKTLIKEHFDEVSNVYVDKPLSNIFSFLFAPFVLFVEGTMLLMITVGWLTDRIIFKQVPI